MERLDITSAPERANIETSIHFARYAIAASLVKDKKVLDIACGEGYGSYLLKRSGANQVVGVDVSSDAIDRARNSFGATGIEFLAADAATIETRFTAEYFDVIISCETIEHIANPAAYLLSLKQLAKKDAVIIISCPNDHWYYPQNDQRNPYHLRKYRFDEFKQLALSVLGENVSWSMGTAVLGFGSTPLDVQQSYLPVPNSWMSFREIGGAYLVSGGEEQEFTTSNCSYFFGVWNATGMPIGAAVFPVSMDTYSRMIQAMDGGLPADEKVRLIALEMEHEALKNSVNSIHDAQLRKAGLHYQAAKAENELLRERLHSSTAEREHLRAQFDVVSAEREHLRAQFYDATAESAHLRVAHDRYLRLRNLVPNSVRIVLIKVVRILGGRKS